MKSTIAVLVVLLSTLAFSQPSSATSTPPGCENGRSKATTCTATFYGPFSLDAFGATFVPCLNNGKGENVVFTDTESTVLFYTVTNGKRNGFFLNVGGGLHGKGQTTGINYTATGSTDYRFSDWVPFNADGSANGDGEFAITDDYYIHSESPATNHIWHRLQRFAITDNGLHATQQPNEVVCK